MDQPTNSNNTQDVLGLLANRPLKRLNKENDLFQLADRATAIKNFISNILLKKEGASFKYDISIIGLFGDWGSGKTTVINEVEEDSKETGKKYKVIRFPAWEYEASDDIALSFLSFLLNETGFSKKRKKKILKVGSEALKGLAEGVDISFMPFLKISPKRIVERLENINEETISSYHDKKKKLEEQYKEVVEEILQFKKGVREEKLVVFIDDLDRCEPENILKMISSLKLFFSGKECENLKVSHFVAIDEEAVKEAIKTKYKNEVKAEEYLEKIIDYSFKLPKLYDIKPIVDLVFKQMGLARYGDYAVRMLVSLKLTNPRKVKKILSKFFLMHDSSASAGEILPQFFRNYSQNREMEKGEKIPYLYDFVVLFFLLIIHELAPEEYSAFHNLEKRGDYFNSVFPEGGGLIDLSIGEIHSLNDILNRYKAGESIKVKEIRGKLDEDFLIEYSRIGPEDVNEQELVDDKSAHSAWAQHIFLIAPFLPDDGFLPGRKNAQSPAIANDQANSLNDDNKKSAPPSRDDSYDYCSKIIELGHERFITNYFHASSQRYLYQFSRFLAQNIHDIINKDDMMAKNEYRFHYFQQFLDWHA